MEREEEMIDCELNISAFFQIYKFNPLPLTVMCLIELSEETMRARGWDSCYKISTFISRGSQCAPTYTKTSGRIFVSFHERALPACRERAWNVAYIPAPLLPACSLKLGALNIHSLGPPSSNTWWYFVRSLPLKKKPWIQQRKSVEWSCVHEDPQGWVFQLPSNARFFANITA